MRQVQGNTAIRATEIAPPPAPLLEPAEVARRLGIQEHLLARWRCTRRHELPFVKLGGLVRYRVEDVEQFVASRTVAA